jgi:hypothetical protein
VSGVARAAGALALAVLVPLATACVANQPVTPPSAAPQPHPVVAPPQAQRILDAVDATVAKAADGRSATLLGSRVAGPARQRAIAEFAVARAAGSKSTAPVRPGLGALTTDSRLVLPQAGPWPRWFLAVGNAAGAPTPVLRVLVSRSAREPYALWGELALLPGAELPRVAGSSATDAGPARVLPDEADGLAARPADVLQRYAVLLTSKARKGSTGGSAKGRSFAAADEFRKQLLDRLAADRTALGRKGLATVTSTHEPTSDPVFAVRTADGGALVIGALQQTYVVDIRPGRAPSRSTPGGPRCPGGSRCARRCG